MKLHVTINTISTSNHNPHSAHMEDRVWFQYSNLNVYDTQKTLLDKNSTYWGNLQLAGLPSDAKQSGLRSRS